MECGGDFTRYDLALLSHTLGFHLNPGAYHSLFKERCSRIPSVRYTLNRNSMRNIRSLKANEDIGGDSFFIRLIPDDTAHSHAPHT